VTFWFAHALTKVGRADQAEAILKRCEAMAGELGLFAEEIDARRQIFLGNTPLFIRARRICSRYLRSGRSPRPRQQLQGAPIADGQYSA